MEPSQSPSPTRRIVRLAVFVIGLALSATALFLAMADLPKAGLLEAFLGARPVYVALLFACVAANFTAKTLRWRALLGIAGMQAPFAQLLLSIMAGQLWNQVYPVRVGDLSRAWLGGAAGERKLFVLSTVAVEKLLDTLAYAVLVVGVVALAPLPPWLNFPAAVLGAAGLGLAGLFGYLALQGKIHLEQIQPRLAWLPAALRGRVVSALQAFFDSLAVLRSNLPAVAAWTALVWLTALLNIYLALLALDIHLAGPGAALSAVALIMVALQAGLTLPSAPLTIGLFEVICKSVLQLYGVDSLPAFTLGVLLHVATMLPILLLGSAGALLVWYRLALTSKVDA